MKNKTKKIAFISSLVAVSLLVVHLINKFIFYINTYKEHLHSDHSHYYQWRFGKIFYTKEGSGPSLLLVHDLNHASSYYEWKEVVATLSKDFTVYSIDLLGCGRSEKPNMIYTNYLYVQLISDFVRDVIGEETSIVSSRFSTSISIMASYIDSKLFNRLILINPVDIETLNKYPKRKHRICRIFLNIPILGNLIYNIENSRYQLFKRFHNDYIYGKKSMSRYINAYSEAAHTGGSSAKYVYTSLRSYYTNTNITHALKALSTPVLLIEGDSCNNAQKIVKEYEAINSSIESTWILNAKELPHIENPEQIANIIRENLQ